MPWTRRQVRFLESSGSPLTSAQKAKMNRELHEDPSMGHKKKGSKEMERGSHLSRQAEDMKKYRGKSTTYDHKRPKRQVVTRYS